jgi:hypothetical protein
MNQQIELTTQFPEAVPSDKHVFLMSTKHVAHGYGVGESTIRNHKRDRPQELLEGQHWVKDSQGNTRWTARGVVQLGFCTQSKQGAEFRLRVENFLMQGNGGTVSNRDAPALPAPNLPTLDSTAAAIADVVVSQLSTEQMLQERVNFHVQAKLDAKVAAVDAASLGKGLAVQWGLQNMAALTEAIATLTNQPHASEAKAQ